MKENIILFLTHFDDYLDACLGLNGGDDGFNLIREMKSKLKAKSKEISIEEFLTQEADIFYEYLKLKNVL